MINVEDNVLSGDYQFFCAYCESVTIVETTGSIPEVDKVVECIHCGKKNKVLDRVGLLRVKQDDRKS